MPLSQIRLKNDAIRIEVGTRAMTRESWQELLHDFQPQVAILCDPSVLLSPMAQAASYFIPEMKKAIEYYIG